MVVGVKEVGKVKIKNPNGSSPDIGNSLVLTHKLSALPVEQARYLEIKVMPLSCFLASRRAFLPSLGKR